MNTHKITIYFDDSDTANIGWAYSIRSYDQYGTYLDESSGPLPQKRRHTGLRALRRALSRIWPAFPSALRQDASWIDSEAGNSWTGSASPGTDWKIHVMPHGPMVEPDLTPGPSGRSPSPDSIRQARAASGLSQTAAAALLHCSRSSWAAWESGVTRMHPAMWDLFRLCAPMPLDP